MCGYGFVLDGLLLQLTQTHVLLKIPFQRKVTQFLL